MISSSRKTNEALESVTVRQAVSMTIIVKNLISSWIVIIH